MSLDLSRAFDWTEVEPLFAALAEQGVDKKYLRTLVSIYTGQTGRVHGSQDFSIQRGVKQGDVLSPLLFNAGLEKAVQSWKLRISGRGICVGAGELLTNIRYADDLLVFAKSSAELAWMTETLQEELAKVGLHLNASKSKVLTLEGCHGPRFWDISGEFVEVLGPADYHKYLGRKLSGNVKERSKVELAHRTQMAWMRFHKHRDVLMDKELHVRSRLKFFQAIVSATLLYGMTACALTAQQMASLDVLQRKMLRRIVGWVRMDGEEWSETMRRMRTKVESALRLYPIESWSEQLLRRQFRMVCRMARRPNEWAMCVSCWNPACANEGAGRARQRPATRWEDRLNAFARARLNVSSWQEACLHPSFSSHEGAYVKFHSSGP